jgi:hypothetical protein
VRELGGASYTLQRDETGAGFALTIWHADRQPLDVVRVQVEGGRVRAALDAVPDRFIEWDEARGVEGDPSLRYEIARYLALASVDAVIAIDPQATSPSGTTLSFGVAPRAGLIDNGAAQPLLEGAENVTCPTGLVEAVAAVGAILQLADGAPPLVETEDDSPTGSLAIASTNGGSDLPDLLSSVTRGVSSASAARTCGERGTLVAFADRQTQQNCVLRSIEAGGQGVAVAALGIAGACTAGMLVTTAGTGSPLCLAPLAGAGIAALSGLFVGGVANLICQGSAPRRVQQASGSASAPRLPGRFAYSQQDYEAAGISTGIAIALAAANTCSPQQYLDRKRRVDNQRCHPQPEGCGRWEGSGGAPINATACQEMRVRAAVFERCLDSRNRRDCCFDPTCNVNERSPRNVRRDRQHQITYDQNAGELNRCNNILRARCR